MVKLEDLLGIIWTVTELRVCAYDDYRLQHEWIFGEKVEETVHQRHRREKGFLSIIDRKINFHGDQKRKDGLWESGWGVNKKNIPQEILEAEVWHMNLFDSWYPDHDGKMLSVSVNMDALTAQALKSELAELERPLPEELDETDDIK